MKTLAILLSGIIACILLQLFLPWWIFAVLTFILFYFIQVSKIFTAFLNGFIIVLIAWFTLYMFFDNKNNSIMSERLAGIFGLENGIVFLMLASVLMGIIGGLAAVSGYALRNSNKKY